MTSRKREAKPSEIVLGFANVLVGALDFFERVDRGEGTLDAAYEAYGKSKKRLSAMKHALQKHGVAGEEEREEPLARKRPAAEAVLVDLCPCGSGLDRRQCHPMSTSPKGWKQGAR